ncbi:uncharacterized protein LOC129595199 isoform X2 [Paramacrobiotus metropolitanus]|nr:uncharacterized protein LOC129595199 isoform X2 [Paramacrobiotus metropolitanus]
MRKCDGSNYQLQLTECPTNAKYLCHQYVFPDTQSGPHSPYYHFKGCREATGRVAVTISPPKLPVVGQQCHWDGTHSCWCDTDGCNSHTPEQINRLPMQYMLGRVNGPEVLQLEMQDAADYLPFRSLAMPAMDMSRIGNFTVSSASMDSALATGSYIFSFAFLLIM